MITTINEFKKTLNENFDNFSNIGKDEDGNLIGNCKICKANGVLINQHVHNIKNENWFTNIFKKKEKRNIPEYTPDPIPSNVDWWTENDIFVFGSNTEGNHAGGAARAAVVNYGAIMGQARSLQGQSYGIVTLDYTGIDPVTIETIGQELDNFIKFAKIHKSLTFWMTKIGTGISRIPFNDIAQLFFDRQFPNNVKLPIEFTK